MLVSRPGGISVSETLEHLVPFTYCPLKVFHMETSHLQTEGQVAATLTAARRVAVTSGHNAVVVIRA